MSEIFEINNFYTLLKENFDTFLILVLILFLVKEGVEDMETIFLVRSLHVFFYMNFENCKII